jgi:hypothetical protein
MHKKVLISPDGRKIQQLALWLAFHADFSMSSRQARKSIILVLRKSAAECGIQTAHTKACNVGEKRYAKSINERWAKFC